MLRLKLNHISKRGPSDEGYLTNFLRGIIALVSQNYPNTRTAIAVLFICKTDTKYSLSYLILPVLPIDYRVRIRSLSDMNAMQRTCTLQN